MTNSASTDLLRRIAALDDDRKKVLEQRLRAQLAGRNSSSGNRLVAAVVGEQIDTAALRAFCESRLPSYMVPQVFAELPELPRTPAGKTDRRALQRMNWSAEQAEGEALVRPRTEIEARLASIWGEVLGFDEIGVHDNFFEVGGDSLLTIRILSRAAKEGLRIAPELFFAHPTIAGQASLVEQSAKGAPEAAGRTGKIPLLPIQDWFFQHIRTDPQYWNQSILFEVDPAVRTTELEAAVRKLVVRHAAFRTRFRFQDDSWSAEIREEAEAAEMRRVELGKREWTAARALMEKCATDINASFDLGVAPLLKAAHFVDAAGPRNYLLLVAHHLVIDAESWRIVHDELSGFLDTVGATKEIGPAARESSPLEWAEHLAALSGSEALADDQRFWEQQLEPGLPELPTDNDADSIGNLEKDAALESFTLDAARTRLLTHQLQSTLRASPYLALLSALGRAFAEWTARSRVVFETEGHGREALSDDIDATGIVGWLTSVYPLVFDARDLSVWADAASALRLVKESVRRIPRNGLSFGLVRDRGALGRFEGAQVLFNFLGRTDYGADEQAQLKPVDSRFGVARSGQCERAFLIEINARLSGGELTCDFSYNSGYHRPDTIRKLGQRFITLLIELLDLAGSPEASASVSSDFPLANLNPEDFDSLSSQLDALDDD